MDVGTGVELECSYGAGDGRTRSGVASMPKERSGGPRLDWSCDWEKYGYDNTRHQLLPLASVCSENVTSFASGALLPSTVNPFPAWHSAVPAPMNSSTSLGPEGDQYSFSHLMSDGCLVPHQSEQKPGSGCSNMTNPMNILPPFTHDLDTFTQNGGFAEDNPYMMPAHLRLGDSFLMGPTSTIDADDLDY